MATYNFIESVFLKEKGNIEEGLKSLYPLQELLIPEGQVLLKECINALMCVMQGQDKVAFELKNSYLPIYILRDVHLEHDGLTSNIDFMVFTNKVCFVIECMNIYGDIEIDAEGNFQCVTDTKGYVKREAFYSPYTQIQHHINMIKVLDRHRNKSIWRRIIGSDDADLCYIPLIVFTDPKTVIRINSAKQEMKGRVIRSDQLIECIREKINKSNIPPRSDKETLDWAKYYLGLHMEVQQDYTKRFEQYKKTLNNAAEEEETGIDLVKESIPVTEKKVHKESKEFTENKSYKQDKPVRENNSVDNWNNIKIFAELKRYRLEKSREENIKPYYIYNDTQLMNLISKMPKNKEELKQVSGFGEAKVYKYGDEILKILDKYKGWED